MNRYHRIGSRLLDHIKAQRNNLKLSVYVQSTTAVSSYKTNGFSVHSKNIDTKIDKFEYEVYWKNDETE